MLFSSNHWTNSACGNGGTCSSCLCCGWANSWWTSCFDGCGGARNAKAWWAYSYGDAFLWASKTTLRVVPLADWVLLSSSEWILSCLSALLQVEVLKYLDRSGNGEGSVLLLVLEWVVCLFVALAAVWLADLGELSVWHAEKVLLLNYLSFLTESRVDTSAKSR